MDTHKSELYEGYQLDVVVTKREEGPFFGSYYVMQQTFRRTTMSNPIAVASEQNNGPHGTLDGAFEKAFRTLRNWIEEEIERERDNRKVLGLGSHGKTDI